MTEAEIRAQVDAIRERMRPLEQQLAQLRAERDVLLTELRRLERGDRREARARLKASMQSGELPTIAELVAGSDAGSFDEFAFSLRTGGEVSLGFPGARRPTLAFTDGAKVQQAGDLAEAARLHEAGWELGSPGRPGVRIHFPGTRQERLVDAADVFARRLSQPEDE